MIAPLLRFVPRARSAHELAAMVVRIMAIVFCVETLVMMGIAGWEFSADVVREALLDSTWLTILSSPLIYWFVAKPFVEAARDAEIALAREVDVKASKAAELEQVLGELRTLLTLNEELRTSLQRSNTMAAASNENTLQRIGADLHDGPAQLLAYALLRLNRFAPLISEHAGAKGVEDLGQMRKALADSLAEVRAISAGLALPELKAMSLGEAVRSAVRWHEDHANRYVQVTFDDDFPDTAPDQLKSCSYRFVQEALNNASRHAHAARLCVRGSLGERLEIEVADDGVGFDAAASAGAGLGLPGLRSRIEALGGRLELSSVPGVGTALRASFPLAALTAEEPGA